MALYHIGNFIKNKRIELGLTQEEFAEGLCSVTTLSRLENGGQSPRSGTLRALLQRLGYSDAAFFYTAGSEEYEIVEIQFKVRQAIRKKEYDTAKKFLDKLAQYQAYFTVSDRQSFEIMDTALRERELSADEFIERLESALRLTRPNYNRNRLPLAFTYEEATAMNGIAGYLGLKGDYDAAIDMYTQLKRYYEGKVADPLEATRGLPVILYNLSKFLGLSGRYDECIEICLQGIRLAKESGEVHLLPRTLYNYAWSLVRRGRKGDLESAKQAAREAYLLSELLEDRPEFLERLEKFMKDNFEEEPPLAIQDNF